MHILLFVTVTLLNLRNRDCLNLKSLPVFAKIRETTIVFFYFLRCYARLKLKDSTEC